MFRESSQENWEQVLSIYKQTFKVLQVQHGKHASLKSHVIQDHLEDFFREAKATYHDCNDQQKTKESHITNMIRVEISHFISDKASPAYKEC